MFARVLDGADLPFRAPFAEATRHQDRIKMIKLDRRAFSKLSASTYSMLTRVRV